MNNICLTMNMRQTFTTNPLWMKVPASGTQTAATYYTYQNDHLGTPMKLLNQSGVTVWSATYDAFGRATVDSTSTVTNNFRYPGQYYDAESGLHYNWMRYYDPNTGRYSTSDPIGLLGGGNEYIYVYSNPQSYIDPTGEFGIVGGMIGAGIEFGIQMAMNGGNIRCIDWADVLMMGAVGAVAPSALGSVGKTYKSYKAKQSLGAQWPRARTANRRGKLGGRMARHTSRIKNEIAVQGAIAAGKYAAKQAIDYPNEGGGCDYECR